MKKKHPGLFANIELNIEQIQLLVFKSSLTLQEVASECFDYEMCSLKTMNELNHVAARLHSWAWSTAAAELMDGRGSGKESPQVIQMSSVNPHVDAQTYAGLTSPKKSNIIKTSIHPFSTAIPWSLS